MEMKRWPLSRPRGLWLRLRWGTRPRVPTWVRTGNLGRGPDTGLWLPQSPARLRTVHEEGRALRAFPTPRPVARVHDAAGDTWPLPAQPVHAAGQVEHGTQVPLICSDGQPGGVPVLQGARGAYPAPHRPLTPRARNEGLFLRPPPGWVAWDRGPGSPAHTCPPAPQSLGRLFLTSRSCHLPSPVGSLHASPPVPGQGSPNLLARPTISCFSPAAPAPAFGPPKANSDHLFPLGPKWDPTPPPSYTSCQANPFDVCSSVTSS